ncbi:MAG TPA: acyltransferase [Woeseiaceae bacterium]|nr:acyltransferase [Woeseiaceae bacterium]
MKSVLRNCRGVLVFAALTVNTLIWFTPIFLLAIVKLLVPIAAFRRALTRILMWLGENWVSVNRLVLAGSGSMQWSAVGLDGLQKEGWYLVLANHQTWVDIIVLQTVFNRRIPFLKFFIKQELIWFPVLGVAWWAFDMPFMKRHSPSYLAKHPEQKGNDLEATRKACEKFRHTPTTVINFIEGTRFSETKRDARKSPYANLLSPRAGGIAVALGSMGELFDKILDVTIVYPDGVPEFWAMCCGERVNMRMDVQVLQVESFLLAGNYEEDREFRRRMHQWLSDLWRAKDQRIESMRGNSQSAGPLA